MAYPLEGDTTQAKERAQRPYPFRHFRFALREFPGGGTFGPFAWGPGLAKQHGKNKGMHLAPKPCVIMPFPPSQ